MDQTIVCSNCKTENPAGNLFCQSCGTRLAGADAAPAMGYTQPPAYPTQPYPQQPPAYPGTYPPAPAGYAPYAAAPQPGYFAPPAISRLGVRVDGYTEVASGAAEKASNIEEAFVAALQERSLPGVTVNKAEFSVGGFTAKRRSFQMVQHPSGSTVAVSFNPFGKDLLVSWDLFVHRPFKWMFIGIMAAIILLVPILFALTFIPGALAYVTSSTYFSSSQYLLGVAILLVAVPYIFQLLGKLLYNSSWYFFVTEPDAFTVDDTLGLSAAVHATLLKVLKENKVDLSFFHPKGDFNA